MAKLLQIVLDASVILKWFLQEDYSDLAEKLKDEFLIGTIDVLIPELAFYEITNVLRYKPNYSIQDLEESISALTKMQLNAIKWDEIIGKNSVNIAYQYGITIYDSSYIAISHQFNCEMVTCDEKLLKKIRNEEKIYHIKNFNLE
ncbi:MAG: Ribonuclease VapC3 [Candidatus Heimdallarchaeota archaeon LC_3]|nr:MAG: Ribonuclease VapC3 [Candidatus Heimdallarchaeota archaeon LC_3]